MERAGVNPDAEFARGVGEELRELAVDRLRLRRAGRRAEVVDVFGQHREVGAGGRGALEQLAGHAQVFGPVVPRVQLADRDSHVEGA